MLYLPHHFFHFHLKDFQLNNSTYHVNLWVCIEYYIQIYLDGVAPLVADPPCANYSHFQSIT